MATKVVLPTSTRKNLNFSLDGVEFIPDFSLEMVNPETAEEWLTHNVNNRKLTKTLVDLYAGDMARGEWRLIGAPIIFSPEGTLLDGQKRLAAVVQSGETTPFVIARNVPEEYRLVIDSGQKRTAAHALQMEGLKDANQVTSIVRLLIPWTERELLYRTPVSNTAIGAFTRKWENELYAAVSIGNRAHVGYGAKQRVAGAAYFRAVQQFGEEFADEMFEKLITGDDIATDNPLGALRRAVQRVKNINLKLDYLAELYYNVRALNAVITDEPLQRMNAPRGDWTEEHFDFVLPGEH